jgi:hypothetical protein
MKKPRIITILIFFLLTLNGYSSVVNNRDIVVVDSGKISDGIIVGKKLLNYIFKNQFDKKYRLSDDVKKVIFVFTKSTGNLTKGYFKKQKKGYLLKKNINYIVDISKMPSLIYRLFALPDFKKQDYSIMIMEDENISKNFKSERYEDYIMVLFLDKKIVKKVVFVNNEKDLEDVLQ